MSESAVQARVGPFSLVLVEPGLRQGTPGHLPGRGGVPDKPHRLPSRRSLSDAALGPRKENAKTSEAGCRRSAPRWQELGAACGTSASAGSAASLAQRRVAAGHPAGQERHPPWGSNPRPQG